MSDTTTTPPPSGTFVQSVARGIAVMRAFSQDQPRQTLSEVAKRTALPRAAARRFLLTLEQLGYVRHDGRLFELTDAARSIAWLPPLSDQARLLLWQATEMLEDHASSCKSAGNDSAAEGALASAHMIRQPTAKKLTDQQWYDLAQRHAIRDWNADGYFESIKAVCADFAAISTPAAADAPTMLNGLTETETAATPSVALTDEQIDALVCIIATGREHRDHIGILPRAMMTIAADALAAHRSQQESASPDAKGVEAAIKWMLNGDKGSHYDNWVGETPFGRILITWKGWKEYPNASVDEFPGDRFDPYGTPDELKAACEAEFTRRLRSITFTAPSESEARKPLTDEWIRQRCGQAWVFETVKKWVREIEAAHGITDAALSASGQKGEPT